MKLKQSVLAAALWAAFLLPAFGQGSPYFDIVLNRNGTPVSGALVRVCTSAAAITGTGAAMTCSPTASIYNEKGLSTPKTNPLTSDANGNFGFWAAPAAYKIVAVLGASAISFDLALPQVSGDDITVTNMNTTGYVEGTKIAAPSAPAAGKLRLYPKDTDEWCGQTSAGVEKCFGGSGSGDVTDVSLSNAGGEFTITGSPCTTGACAFTLAFATTPTGTGAFVRATSPTFITQITTPKVVTTGASQFDGVEAAAPGSPAATHWLLYPKTSAGWCQKNSAGSETCLAANLASPAFFSVSCTGTSTSSTTLSLQGFGSTSGACTAAATNRAMRLGTGGTLKNLYVRSDAGVNASSLAFTIYQCTSANQPNCTVLTSTGITCTVGTSNGCSDLVNTFTINAGDAIVIKYTTQTSETGGNIVLSFEKQ